MNHVISLWVASWTILRLGNDLAGTDLNEA